ncbi:MAG: glycosyl hydrolase family 18 protein [Eubacteriales bacterium]
MKNRRNNPDVNMVDVFYERNNSRTRQTDNNDSNNKNNTIKVWGTALKVVLIIAALILMVAILPAKLIKPAKSTSGDSVLIKTAPDAEPIEDDGSIPDESLWRENISPIEIEDKIYLAWDDPSNRNWTLTEMPPNVNVLAPVWFKLGLNETEDGIDFVNADESTTAFSYVQTCHKNGVKVWGTVQCINYDLAEVIMTDMAVQQQLIDQILLWINSYNMDGINIDFEKMNPKHKQLFNNFCANLKAAMPEGMPLSACITVKLVSESAETNPWQAYDRGGLAEVIDYITVMTYGEHDASTKKPVASIDWIDLHIRRLLEEIPSEKLIMGIPFYGVDYRAEVVDEQTLSLNPIWKNSGHTATIFQLNLLLETGQYLYSGTPIVLDYWINKGGWNAELGISDYSFVDTDGIQHTIWIDDENSIYQKARLADDYNLAGVAIWKKNLGTESMFEAVFRAWQD